MKKKEQDLAVCQMVTINAVLRDCPMDIETAIREMNLDNKECLKLAEEENLYWIAGNIRKQL